MKNLSRELAAAIEASRKAEGIIMKHYRSDMNVWQKSDSSPVTPADIEAEKVIIETIKHHFPDHGILSEENSGANIPGEHINREYVWVVDPIDGTKNYIRGIPFFGTQIALLRNGVPVLGVSNMPSIQEMIYGEKGRGAYLNGTKIHVSRVDKIAEAHISLGGLNHFLSAGKTENILNIVRAVGRVRGFGDAYAYHLLVTGRCEAVIEEGIRIWDIAAFCAIVREAGGNCTDLQGKPIDMETTSIVLSNGILHSKLLDPPAKSKKLWLRP